MPASLSSGIIQRMRRSALLLSTDSRVKVTLRMKEPNASKNRLGHESLARSHNKTWRVFDCNMTSIMSVEIFCLPGAGYHVSDDLTPRVEFTRHSASISIPLLYLTISCQARWPPDIAVGDGYSQRTVTE